MNIFSRLLSACVFGTLLSMDVGMAASGNRAHDLLTAMPVGRQAEFLGRATGEGCVGQTAFFMGMTADKVAFWSVRCTNNASYSVQIAPDTNGSTTVLECSILKAFAQVDCFKKLRP